MRKLNARLNTYLYHMDVEASLKGFNAPNYIYVRYMFSQMHRVEQLLEGSIYATFT